MKTSESEKNRVYVKKFFKKINAMSKYEKMREKSEEFYRETSTLTPDTLQKKFSI